MNQKVKELVERVRLTEEEILAIIRDNYGTEDEPHPIPVGKIAQAQLKKVLNDPDLALIDREKELQLITCGHAQMTAARYSQDSICPLPKAGWLPVLLLAEELKEVEG